MPVGQPDDASLARLRGTGKAIFTRAVEFANLQEPHPLSSALFVAVLAVAMKRFQCMLLSVVGCGAPILHGERGRWSRYEHLLQL